MAITLTGAKYSSASVSSAGTATVTVGTTPFVSGDFAVPRRVDLFNSAGTTFKGMAFVRNWVSTSQLSLESAFFDPKTGTAVTQVVGDTVLVSKNWTDVVQAGIAVAGDVVAITDTITFGTSGSVNSVAFHDESKVVNNTFVTADAKMYVFAGGLVTFGHLQSYADKAWYGGCFFTFSTVSFTGAFTASSTSAQLMMFGGAVSAQGASPCYFGAGYNNGSSSLYGTDWAFLWALETQFNGVDVMSVNGGGAWTTGTNHVLENCSYVGAGTNQILQRWSNGTVMGGQYKIPRNSSAPLSVFGADAVGTYAIGAPSGERAIVLDMGSGNVLWRCGGGSGDLAQTINITNLISTDYRAGYFSAPDTNVQTNATKNVYFKDNYGNLQDASGLAVIRNSDWSVDSSATASGAASTVALTAYHSTGTGHSLGSQRGPWTYRIRKYGYDEIEGAIAETSYSLGTAGTAFNVAFGGAVNQIARTSLTDSEATALAYTGITVTDHNASPVTWNSKSWSITVTVDLATYPSRTAAQVFAHIKASIAKTATWNGKAGLLWHVLMEEEGAGYISQRGKSGGAGATLKGVRVIDQAGNPLPGVTYMTADDGTTYTPAVAVTLTISAQVSLAGAEIRIYDLDNSPAGSLGTELGGIETATDPTFPYTGSAGNSIWVQIMLAGYEEFGQAVTMPASSGNFVVTLTPEANT